MVATGDRRGVISSVIAVERPGGKAYPIPVLAALDLGFCTLAGFCYNFFRPSGQRRDHITGVAQGVGSAAVGLDRFLFSAGGWGADMTAIPEVGCAGSRRLGMLKKMLR